MNHRLITLAILLAATFASGLSAQRFSTLSGTVVDQSGAALPGVTVVANDRTRGSSHEVSTDRNGRFELIGLVEGSYVLEADLPGFETFHENLALNGQDLSRDITLQIGSLEEIVTVVNDPNAAPAAPSERSAPLPASCGPSTGDAGGVRIGGQIRVPRKIRHVAPIYPQGSPAGVVTIVAVIGTDGFVKEANATNDAPAALARSAINAVRQWEFDPTLLNCEAVDVRMSVTVDFR
jgi:Carboxypeptidase regulatory-like domain/Gram-negative bacterial TonB protein C-terminal